MIKIKEYFKIALILRPNKFIFANYNNTKELIVTMTTARIKIINIFDLFVALFNINSYFIFHNMLPIINILKIPQLNTRKKLLQEDIHIKV